MSQQDASPAPSPRYYFHLMITHPTEPRILMLPGESGWALPHFESEERFHDVGVPMINRETKNQLGLDTIVLRSAHVVVDRGARKRVEYVFVLENHSPEWTPPTGALWVGSEELAGLKLARPDHREVIATWLREDETGDLPTLRAPWARRGWFQAAANWMLAELARLGIAPEGAVEQFRSWGISCVLRVPTSSGLVYFKAVPPLFITEPVITRALASRYPEHIPTPLAIAEREEDSWMLLRDFGGHELHEATLPQWREMLGFLGRIHRESAATVDELLALGCADRRLDRLAAQVDPLINDPEAMTGLEAAEVEELQALAPNLKAMCERLAGYAVPQTLVHGDFHAGNIVVSEGNYIFFDWTDACIGHPFFDLPTLFDGYTPEAVLAEQTRLRDVYLQTWAAYEPPERLLEAFDLGYKLGMLHQAISYQHILASMEPASRSDLEGGLRYWARRLLRSSTAA